MARTSKKCQVRELRASIVGVATSSQEPESIARIGIRGAARLEGHAEESLAILGMEASRETKLARRLSPCRNARVSRR
jgi:hypothetical protein